MLVESPLKIRPAKEVLQSSWSALQRLKTEDESGSGLRLPGRLQPLWQHISVRCECSEWRRAAQVSAAAADSDRDREEGCSRHGVLLVAGAAALGRDRSETGASLSGRGADVPFPAPRGGRRDPHGCLRPHPGGAVRRGRRQSAAAHLVQGAARAHPRVPLPQHRAHAVRPPHAHPATLGAPRAGRTRPHVLRTDRIR